MGSPILENLLCLQSSIFSFFTAVFFASRLIFSAPLKNPEAAPSECLSQTCPPASIYLPLFARGDCIYRTLFVDPDDSHLLGEVKRPQSHGLSRARRP